MSQYFLHSPLLWGMLLVGVPVLIHLINMLRHRRVQWAAMEFLLESQKKNRTWIVFKQLLLLLLRMLAVAAVVLIVAQPLLHNRLGSLFGSTQTHHILLLDDSFSMSDRWTDTSAFAEAKTVIGQIGTALKSGVARQRQPQTFTLLRFSRVGRLDRGTRPDLLEVPVNSEFVDRLEETLRDINVSQSSAGPVGAIEAIGQLLGNATGQRRIVYLISDFRARQWDDPSDLRRQLLQLNTAEVEIHLINCVERTRPNLAIAALDPADGIRAAGVPWFMEVSVQNFGTETAKGVSVLLEEDGHVRPAVTIAEIPPGSAVKQRFPVHFTTAGQHQLTAQLEGDTVAADNFRYSAIELPLDVPVLLIDGRPDARDARYVSMASAPGGTVATGVNPQIETTAYLNQAKPLEKFSAIALLNVERLDPAGVEALEQYVAAGGGLAIFLGEQSDSRFINAQLYRNGQGLFPLPLGEPTVLPIDRLGKAPDLQVETHPIFRILAGKRNGFISTVAVQRYFAAKEGWQPDPESTTRVIAWLRNGAPLAVERRFGEGRVVALLTTAAPVWNNWARNPSFVVAVQDMQAYLSQRRSADDLHRVGSKLELQLDPEQYMSQVRFVTPTGNGATSQSATIDAVPTQQGPLAVSLSQTDAGGMYEARLTRTDGTAEVRRFAINVDAGEGDLDALSGPQLATRLEGVDYRYEQAATFRYAVNELAGYNVSQWLLYLLILLLIGEQILAYSISYHPPARRRTAAAGGTP